MSKTANNNNNDNNPTDKTQQSTWGKANVFMLALIGLLMLLIIGGGLCIYQTLQAIQKSTDKFHNHVVVTLTQQQEKIDHSQNMLTTLSSQINKTPVHVTLAEVDYLLRIANYELIFERNAKNAIKLLSLANSRVQSLQDTRLDFLSKALSHDIRQLEAVPSIDINALVQTLDRLSFKINELPSLPQSKLTTVAVAKQADTQVKKPKDETGNQERAQLISSSNVALKKTTHWKQAGLDWLSSTVQSLKAMMKNAMIIRHDRSENPVVPLLSSNQQAFLIENIRLQLSQATWAILHYQSSLYQTRLKHAEHWLTQYFSYPSPQLNTIIKQLKNLRSINIDPELPTLKSSFSAVREARHRLNTKEFLQTDEELSSHSKVNSIQ